MAAEGGEQLVWLAADPGGRASSSKVVRSKAAAWSHSNGDRRHGGRQHTSSARRPQQDQKQLMSRIHPAHPQDPISPPQQQQRQQQHPQYPQAHHHLQPLPNPPLPPASALPHQPLPPIRQFAPLPPLSLSSEDGIVHAISQLQAQSTRHATMDEGLNARIASLEQAINGLQQDMRSIVSAAEDIRNILREQRRLPSPHRNGSEDSASSSSIHPADLAMLSGQVATVSRKSDEVDTIRVQLDQMRSRMKALEDEQSRSGGTVAAHPSPPAYSRW